MSYLIDTNVISELVKPKQSKKVVQWFNLVPADSLYISVLSLGEIRKGVEKVSDIQRKEKSRIWLEHDLPAWFANRVIAIDNAIADRWGRLQAQMQRPLPAIDSLIAATALHCDLTLVTRNDRDFDYPCLEIINPWVI